jgi:hypothetical protein
LSSWCPPVVDGIEFLVAERHILFFAAVHCWHDKHIKLTMFIILLLKGGFVKFVLNVRSGMRAVVSFFCVFTARQARYSEREQVVG